MEIENIFRKEITWKGEKIVISLVKLPFGHFPYELIVMYPDGTEIEQRCFDVQEDALTACDETYTRYTREAKKQEETQPLVGKYKDLSEALKKAVDAAREAVKANPEDGGACNFDSPTLFLPRWNEKMVKRAASEAGVGCWKWTGWGDPKYVFSIHCGGQGNSRTRAAEAASKTLKSMGYNAGMYYAMD